MTRMDRFAYAQLEWPVLALPAQFGAKQCAGGDGSPAGRSLLTLNGLCFPTALIISLRRVMPLAVDRAEPPSVADVAVFNSSQGWLLDNF